MWKRFLLLLIVLNFSSLAFALTLDQAIHLAYKNNYILQKQQARLQAAKSKTWYKSWLEQPSLIYNFKEIPVSSLNPSRAAKNQYGIGQKIPFPYKLWLKHDLALNDESKSNFELQQMRYEVRAKVTAAYYNLYLSQKEDEITKQSLDILAQLKEIAANKYRINQAAYSDLLSAQTEYAVLKEKSQTLQQKIALAETKLNNFLNQKINSTVETDPNFEFNLLPKNTLKEKAMKNNYSLQKIKAEQELQAGMLLLKKLDYVPDLSLTYLKTDHPATGMSDWDFMLMAEVPLWFWAKQGEVNQEYYMQSAIDASYQDQINEINEKVEEYYIDLDESLRMEKAFRKEVLPKNKAALNSAQTAYINSKMDFISLLNIQKMYQENQIEYQRHLANIQASKAELEALLGQEI